MKFMLLMKSDEQAEAGVLPDEQIIAAMGKFNQDLVESGALLGAEGLHPTARGARIRIAGGKRTTTDGPFAEAKEVMGGFYLIDCASKAEAVEWAKQLPLAGRSTVELRQIWTE